MNITPKKTQEPRRSYTFDAIPDDNETQDELNRRLRKPGELGYCPLVKKGEASDCQMDGAQGDSATGPKKVEST